MTEAIWTLLGAVGAYMGWGNLQDSRADTEALKHSTLDHASGEFQVMRILAYGHYRNDLFRFAKHVTVLTIGAIACLLPPAPIGSSAVTPTGLVVTGGLFTIVLLIIMASALDKRQRDAIEEIELVRKNGNGNGGHH